MITIILAHQTYDETIMFEILQADDILKYIFLQQICLFCSKFTEVCF